MRQARAFFFVCAGIFLLALRVPVALAGGVNLNWGTVCYTEVPAAAMGFACNTNLGSQVMTSSFSIDTPMPDFVQLELEMEGMANYPVGGDLPDWWKLGDPPDCRTGSAQFISDMSTAPQVSCFDWTAGCSYSVFSYTSATAVADIHAFVVPCEPLYLQGGVEYYVGQVKIRNSKTVGTGACSGCSDRMTWELYRVKVYGADGRIDVLSDPIPGGNNYLTWDSSLADVEQGPGVTAFTLEGVRPNPSHGERLIVAFTLPSAAPARIELVDVNGRRVVEREVGSLGAGPHALDLGEGLHLAPGLYLVRLTQGTTSRTTRVAVLR
jgi:hypothetical protein